MSPESLLSSRVPYLQFNRLSTNINQFAAKFNSNGVCWICLNFRTMKDEFITNLNLPSSSYIKCFTSNIKKLTWTLEYEPWAGKIAYLQSVICHNEVPFLIPRAGNSILSHASQMWQEHIFRATQKTKKVITSTVVVKILHQLFYWVWGITNLPDAK